MSTSVASVMSHFPDAENGFTTTLASTISSGAGTVPLNSVSGYTNGQPAVFVVDPSDVTKKQTFTGIIDTAGVQVTSVVWTAGTNQSHSGGATVVDYATATHVAMISKGILVHADQDGTLKAGAVDNSAVVAAGVLTNAKFAAGESVGVDGYTSGSGTWTYASATTFTVPAADIAAMSIGTKIKLTQTTAKYFYVTNLSGTTVTVTGGTDYTVANAAITSPYWSNSSSPAGFPQWFAYTATYGGFSASPTSTNRFNVNGRLCTVIVYPTANGTSNANTFTITLPFTSANPGGTRIQYGVIKFVNNSVVATTFGLIQLSENSATASLYQDTNNAVWSTSNAKSAAFTFSYEI